MVSIPVTTRPMTKFVESSSSAAPVVIAKAVPFGAIEPPSY